jgi:hypothetical protein
MIGKQAEKESEERNGTVAHPRAYVPGVGCRCAVLCLRLPALPDCCLVLTGSHGLVVTGRESPFSPLGLVRLAPPRPGFGPKPRGLAGISLAGDRSHTLL